MRRIIVFCIIATVLAALTSCGTAKRFEQLPTAEEERTQLWAGKEYGDIVQSYGAPDRIAPDGNDGSILIYETVSTVMETDSDDASTTVEDRDYTHFYLDQEGFCYLVESNQYVPGIARTKTGNGSWLTSFGAISVMALSLPIIIYILDEREM